MLTTVQQVEGFLNEYKRSRVIIETSVRAALNRALEFEKKYHKPFYQFTVQEVLTMYKSVHAISARSLQNINLILKHASRWLIYKENLSLKSVYEDITRELVQECVDMKKQESLIFTREDLTNIQNELLNDTDKGILEMLFLGAGGNWLKELTFFDLSQMSRKDGVIYFRTGKVIRIDNETYELLHKACMEEELISFGETTRISKVKSHGFFKQRFNALSANDNPRDEQDLERRFRFVQRRLMLISKNLEIQLTAGNVQMSGLLHLLKQGVEASGTNLRTYVRTDEARQIAMRYDIFSDFYSQILIEKFERYFL